MRAVIVCLSALLLLSAGIVHAQQAPSWKGQEIDDREWKNEDIAQGTKELLGNTKGDHFYTGALAREEVSMGLSATSIYKLNSSEYFMHGFRFRSAYDRAAIFITRPNNVLGAAIIHSRCDASSCTYPYLTLYFRGKSDERLVKIFREWASSPDENEVRNLVFRETNIELVK